MWSDPNYAAQGLKAKEPSCIEKIQYLWTQFANARLFCNLTVCLRLRNLPMKAAPHTELPEILHHSILTTYYHTWTDTMLTLVLFSLDVLHTLWCRLVCRNAVELNFVKTGLKCKFGLNPQSFSHELSSSALPLPCIVKARGYVYERGGV